MEPGLRRETLDEKCVDVTRTEGATVTSREIVTRL
jgi:hypothetical protein